MKTLTVQLVGILSTIIACSHLIGAQEPGMSLSVMVQHIRTFNC